MGVRLCIQWGGDSGTLLGRSGCLPWIFLHSLIMEEAIDMLNLFPSLCPLLVTLLRETKTERKTDGAN